MSSATIRVSLRKLDAITEKCGGGRRGAGASEDDGVDLSAMTPYRREQYKLAKDLKALRENIAKLDAVEAKSGATATDRASVSVKVRKGMQSIKEKQKALQKIARDEGGSAGQEYQNMVAHIEKTEKLYSSRFRGGEGPSVPSVTANTPLLEKNKSQGRNDPNVEYKSLHDDEEFTMFFSMCQKNDQAMDRALDRIQQGTSRMKETAIQIKQEVTIQKRMLDEVELKADRIHEQMLGLNGKLKKTLESVENDKMCLYIICCILLLGVAGYALYVSGALPK